MLFAGHGYADDHHANRNPATIGYVNTAIEASAIKNAYLAGTAISIVNRVVSGAYTGGTGIRVDGAKITATGATEEYTGTGAINVTNEVISARFTGANGIFVPVDGSGNNTGAIQGPTGGTGITVTNATTSAPGAINLDTVYVSGDGITFTGSGTTTISTDTVYVAGDGITFTAASGKTTISTTPLAIGDLYQGGIIYYLDETGQHGLAISLSDQAVSVVKFSGNDHEYTGGSGIGAGIINTAAVIGRSSTDEIAANYATKWYVNDLGETSSCAPSTSVPGATIVCRGGWYLPSLFELATILNNLANINAALAAQISAGGTALNSLIPYWTSTSDLNNPDHIYTVLFSGSGTIATAGKNGNNGIVRAIQQF